MFSTAIMEGLTARGLDIELADKLGFDSVRRDGTDFLVIPCLRDGRIHRRKFRTLGAPKRFMQEGAGPIPWNEDVLRDETLRGLPLIITEGELDAMAAIQCGFERVISVPDGAPAATNDNPFDAQRYAWIKEIAPYVTRDLAPEIILASDGDEPGRALMQDLSVMLGRFRCKFLQYPLTKDGSRRLKDLNEVLLEHGNRGVVETIARATYIQSEGVFRMSELPDLPPAKPYKAGFDLFDEHFRLRLGDFSVVTGIPTHGKSSFVNDYFCRQVQRHNFRAVWASFEQDPKRDHRRALRTWFNRHPEHDLQPREVAEADAWIDQHHRFIVVPEDEDVTVDWMIDRLEQAVVQHDCQIAVLDPWNEMDHMRERDETETEYVGRSIKRFKRFARAFGVHLCIVAHPTKLPRGENGKTLAPNLYDIAGSSHWNNKADVGVIVHRENEDDTLIKVAKSRYHTQIGVPGTVRMQFSRDELRYVEQERLV